MFESDGAMILNDGRGGEAEFDDEGAVLGGGSTAIIGFVRLHNFPVRTNANVVDEADGVSRQRLLVPLQQTGRTARVGFRREHLEGWREEGRRRMTMTIDMKLM